MLGPPLSVYFAYSVVTPLLFRGHFRSSSIVSSD